MPDKDLEQQPQFSDNQTAFESEEPLFEDLYRPENPKISQENQPVQPWYKNIKIMIGGLAAVVFFLLSLGIIVLRMAQSTPEDDAPDISPQQQEETLSELEQRFSETQSAFEAANPSQLELNLPPLDYVFSLETEERIRN